ncbi:MAG: hypothetical protein AB7Q42_15125 [Acidimicrobiia bacterium]
MQLPALRSPLARAVVPVLAGIAFFAVLAGILYAAAVFMSRNPQDTRLGDPTFAVGRVDRVAESIEENGPQLFPDLKSPEGERSIVVAHQGADDLSGWRVYRPFPADRAETCFADQSVGTAQFTDCEGRVVDVSQLALADDVQVVIEDQETLVLVFEGAVATTTTAG